MVITYVICLLLCLWCGHFASFSVWSSGQIGLRILPTGTHTIIKALVLCTLEKCMNLCQVFIALVSTGIIIAIAGHAAATGV